MRGTLACSHWLLVHGAQTAFVSPSGRDQRAPHAMHVHHLALALPQCLSVGCLHPELLAEHMLLFESVNPGRMKMAARETVLEGSVPFALGSAW